MASEKIVTIFRHFAGEVIALFPEVPGSNHPAHCLSYQHLGQHGAADCQEVIQHSRPATPEESAGLRHELESLCGYEIIERRHYSYAMLSKRINAL